MRMGGIVQMRGVIRAAAQSRRTMRRRVPRPTAPQRTALHYLPLCDIPLGCFFTGPWTVTRSSLRMLRRVAAFCRPLRPVFLLGSWSPVVGVLVVVGVV